MDADFERYAARLPKERLENAKTQRLRGKKLDLAEYLSKSPGKDCTAVAWSTYLKYTLPVLTDRLQAFRSVDIRRAKFKSYARTDRALDDICKRICSLGATSSNASEKKPRERRFHGSNVLVAFGNACGTSTGFGYAPVPQARLRHRLEHVHRCRVTLIHEFCTSRYCSGCKQRLVFIGVKSEAEQKELDEQKKISEDMGVPKHRITGVLKCLSCSTSSARIVGESLAPRLHWHRDVNAAINIGAIYKMLAGHGIRPDYLEFPDVLRARRQAAEDARAKLAVESGPP